jgi:hypothetical protein
MYLKSFVATKRKGFKEDYQRGQPIFGFSTRRRGKRTF